MTDKLTRGGILGIASNTDVFTRGEIYYKTGKVKNITSQQGDGSRIVKAVVEGNYKDYEASVLFDIDERVKGYKCTCESHSIWRGACKHVVAALFSLMLEDTVDFSQVRMESAAKGVADEFEKQIYLEIDDMYVTENESGSMALRPSVLFSADKSEILLELSIGESRAGRSHGELLAHASRMYIVKNIQELLDNIRGNKVASYGKKLTFCHSTSVFDTESQRLIRFLDREEQAYKAISKSIFKRFGYFSYSRDNPQYIPLTSQNFDDFFELYMNKTLPVSTASAPRRPVHFTGVAPDVHFDLDFGQDKITLSAQFKSEDSIPEVLMETEGERYGYLLINSRLHRLPKSRCKMLASIFNALSSVNGPITFANSEVGRFKTLIYPALKKAALVGSVVGEPASLLQIDMHAKMYFEADGRDVRCNVFFCYGDAEINPLAENEGITRDVAEEYMIIRMLHSMGFGEDKDRGAFFLKGDELIYDFLHKDLDDMYKTAEIYVSDELRSKAVKKMAKGFGARLRGNLLELTPGDWDFSLNDLMEAMESYNAKKKFHRLKDGSFISLESEEVRDAVELVSAMDISKKDIHREVIELPRYRALYLDAVTKGGCNIKKDETYTKLTEDFNSSKKELAPISKEESEDSDTDSTAFTVPESLENILRSYQKTGFKWLKMLSSYGFGGILADDMGLGKTIQVIALLVSEKMEHEASTSLTGASTSLTGASTSLVVAPTSLIYNWEKEIKRFAPMLNARVVSGTPERRGELLEDKDADVFITTYDMLKRDIGRYQGMETEFAYVIADEAQYIKNPLTQNAKSLKSIKGRVKLALTGTPMENSLTELWSIFDFVLPGYLHSQNKFTRLYETPIVKNDDKERARRLQKQTAPFILRRVKSDVLKELPEKTETTLYAEMLPDQKKLYLANLLKARGELEQLLSDGTYAKSQIQILAQLTRLRQICCHPALYVDNYSGGSGKLDLAVETAQRAVESGHRMLVFSQFTSMLDLLKRAMDENGISYFYLDGGTESKLRSEMTDKFNLGEKDAFLISLKAGGTGLNLTGADVVIHYDPWWNPAVMDQASDRAHRYGQKRAVQVFNLVAKDSIEEKILSLQSKKRDLIDSVITEGASFINKMSQDDVKELFSD